MAIEVPENVVVSKLDELGLSDDTIVCFTSDNGGLSTSEGRPTSNLPLRGMKHNLYEGGIRVPTIVRWPGRIAAGSTSDLPATGADVFPTITAAAGGVARIPEELDGVSLLPELTGEGKVATRDLFWYYPHFSPQGSDPGAGGHRL